MFGFEILQNYHEGPTTEVLMETEGRIRKSFYRPSFSNDVQKYINSCDIYQTDKYNRKRKQKLMLSPSSKKR